MKKLIGYIFQILCVFSVLAVAQAETIHVGFFKVAGTNDVMPGSAKHYARFGIPSYDDGRITFAASATFFVNGLYNNIPGYVQLVADNQTDIPGSKHVFFSNFFNDTDALAGSPSMYDGQIVFYAQSSIAAGLYCFKKNRLSLIADTRTVMPSSKLAFERLSYPYLLANGNVEFLGGSGQFYGVFGADAAGKLQVLMDANTTAIPEGKGSFTKLLSLAVRPGKSETDYAIIGAGSSGQMGVYLSHQYSLARIADRNTKMPGGVGFFSHFSQLDYSDRGVGFIGDGLLGEEGVYMSAGKNLQTIVTTKDLVPEGEGRFSHFDHLAINNDGWVAFQASGEFGEDGIYLSVPRHGLFKLLSRHDTINGRQVHSVSIGPKSLVGNHLAMRITFQDKSIAEYIATLTLSQY